MEYQVHVQHVDSRLTGVVRRCAAQRDLSTIIPQCCGEVWNYFRTANLPRPGRHIALYLDCQINLECGVEVAQPFVGNDQVICSSTPAGTAATTAHFGPYQLLGQAHSAIHDWCAKYGHSFAGPSWEIYGHWTDDPTQLRTDVYFLLE